MTKIIIYTDGGSRGNPGPAGVGVVIANEKNQILKKYAKDIGVRTNNEAEYEGVILAFDKLKRLIGKDKAKKTEVEVRMDSQLVVRQMNGEYRIKEEKLFPLFIKIWNAKIGFGKVSFKHILREKNKEADLLANEAMDGKAAQEGMF